VPARRHRRCFARPSATGPAGYTAAFALLAVPSVLAVLLAARTAAPERPDT